MRPCTKAHYSAALMESALARLDGLDDGGVWHQRPVWSVTRRRLLKHDAHGLVDG